MTVNKKLNTGIKIVSCHVHILVDISSLCILSLNLSSNLHIVVPIFKLYSTNSTINGAKRCFGDHMDELLYIALMVTENIVFFLSFCIINCTECNLNICMNKLLKIPSGLSPPTSITSDDTI